MKVTPSILSLAERIAKVENASPEQKEEGMRFCWYMTNIANPVIKQLWDNFRRENGILPHFPPEDRERLSFELSLLHPDMIQEIRIHVAQKEAELIRQRRL